MRIQYVFIYIGRLRQYQRATRGLRLDPVHPPREAETSALLPLSRVVCSSLRILPLSVVMVYPCRPIVRPLCGRKRSIPLEPSRLRPPTEGVEPGRQFSGASAVGPQQEGNQKKFLRRQNSRRAGRGHCLLNARRWPRPRPRL